MIDWLINNKEWFFSGFGVVILSALITLSLKLISCFYNKKRNINNVNQIATYQQDNISSIARISKTFNLKEKTYTTIKILVDTQSTKVYKVSDSAGQLFILKILSKNICSVDVQKEIKDIISDHLVPLIDIFELNEDIVKIYPYINGIRVSQILQNNDFRFEGELLGQFIYDISKAIELLHEKNIFHRDIHPDNIILSFVTKKFILVDYSFAIKGHKYYHPVGRSGYSDLSQLSGFCNETTDLYSFGVTLYNICFSKNLTPSENIFPDNDSSLLPKFPPAGGNFDYLSQAVQKLVSPHIEHRFKTVLDFICYIRKERTVVGGYCGYFQLDVNLYVLMGHLQVLYFNNKDELIEFLKSKYNTKELSDQLKKYCKENLQ